MVTEVSFGVCKMQGTLWQPGRWPAGTPLGAYSTPHALAGGEDGSLTLLKNSTLR